MSSRGTARLGASARSGRLHRSHQTRTPKSPRKKTTPAATPTTTPPKFGMSASANAPKKGTCDEDVGEINDRRNDANAPSRFGRWHENPEGPSADFEDLGIRVALASRPKQQSFDGHVRTADALESIRLARGHFPGLTQIR